MSKRFGATQALDNVSFDLARGSVHALLGGNGSGKSTLIKILAGVQQADDGELELGGRSFDLRAMTPTRAREAGLHFVHQERSTFPGLSVAENLLIGRGFDTGRGHRIRWSRVRRHAAEVLDRFQIAVHPDTELGELGPATQTMIAIARALQDQEDADDGVLLLDEPTASLPDLEVELLLDAIARYAAAGQTIVYVTHRLDEVFAIADRATVLRDGRLAETVSPRTLTHDRLVELIMGRSVELVKHASGGAPGAAVLTLIGLAAGKVRPLDLVVRSGEVVGLAGLIGSGRSSLLRALFGALPVRCGEIRVDGVLVSPSGPHAAMAAGFAFVSEDRARDSAFPALTVRENLSLTTLDNYWRAGVLDQRAERRDSWRLLTKFLIGAESVDSPLSSLSGGNQQKTILARWLRLSPRVLLLDEPTQGVDAGARVEIYELVRRSVEAGAAALVASSDFDELTTMCNRVVVLRKGSIVGELSGAELTVERLHQLSHTQGAATP